MTKAIGSFHGHTDILKGQETLDRKAGVDLGSGGLRKPGTRFPKQWSRPLDEDILSQSDKRTEAGLEGLVIAPGKQVSGSGGGGGHCVYLYSKSLSRRPLRSVFQTVSHDPFLGHKINLVGTHWHFFNEIEKK